jgi:hypothetical protein
MTSLVDSLITLNQDINYGRGYDMFFPDGYHGETVFIDLNDGPYTVPDEKTLYITNAFLQGSVIIETTDNNVSGNDLFNATNYLGYESGQHSLNNPIILSQGKTIYSIGNSTGDDVVNGFLVNSGVTPIIWSASEDYIVEDGKRLYITHVLGVLHINDIQICWGCGDNFTLGQPIIVDSGSSISGDMFNGYIVDEDYFSSVSNSNSNNGTPPPSINSSFVNFDASSSFSAPGGGNSGGLGTYTETIDTITIAANTMVEVYISHSTSASGYMSGQSWNVGFQDLTNNEALDFLITSDGGISFGGGLGESCSGGSPSGQTNLSCSGYSIMKKFFENETIIEVSYSSSASTINYAWCNNCGGSSNSIELGISLLTFN